MKKKSPVAKLFVAATIIFLSGCGGGGGGGASVYVKFKDEPAPVSSPSSYRIAYSANVFMGGEGELHVYTWPAGTDETIVSDGEVEAFDYNGRSGKIVYDFGQYLYDTKLRTINPDGSGDSLLYEADYYGDIFPIWSPDGFQVSFSFYDQDTGARNIYAINSDGTGLTEVVGGSTFSLKNSWSPDGSEIVTHTGIVGSDPSLCLVVAAADGSTLTQITSAAGVDVEPIWSPDGSKILFARSASGLSGFALYVYNVTTKQSSLACADCTDNNGHLWSPDGRRIATVVMKPSGDVLYIISAGDGTFDEYDLNQTDYTAYYRAADWSFDGRYLLIFETLVYSEVSDNTKLYLFEISSETMTEIVDLADNWNIAEARFLD